jgi:branched-chain amino acid transport system ATP-binding protein
MLLDLTGVQLSFGGLYALRDFSLSVGEGEMVGLIGPNGAGKTTTFNVISGLYPPSKGVVRFRDQDLTGCPAHEMAARGIARTFQNIRLFDRLTVLENVQVASHWRRGYRLWDAAFRNSRFAEAEQGSDEEAEALLATFGLYERKHERATSLPYGEQRRLEIARALASKPSLLLLDEPAAGMNPAEKEQLIEQVGRLRDQRGYSIVLIEHDMPVIKSVSDRVVALDHGIKIAEGTYDQVASNQQVIEAYLGKAGEGSGGELDGEVEL